MATTISGSTSLRVTGTIELGYGLEGQVKPGSVIFVVATAAADPDQRALAVAKLSLATFPIPFRLGSGDLMRGEWGKPVNISVRLDQDGDPSSKLPGDMVGDAVGNPVKPGDNNVRVVLDRVLN